MAKLEVEIVPALSDNYVYLVREAASGAVAVIDPAEAAPVRAALDALGWRPTHILNTHHHHDHTGGNVEIKRAYGCTLVGPKAESGRISGLDVELSEGDVFALGEAEAQIFETPGHTSGHIAFWFEPSSALFCGDTLFVLGCGRVFEGTPEQMWSSLEKLRRLPADALVYCGHEYTQSNARFALSVDPGNAALQGRARETDDLRAAGKPTVPSTIGTEREANPFLRCDDEGLKAAAGLSGKDPVQVFAEVRRRKDNF